MPKPHSTFILAGGLLAALATSAVAADRAPHSAPVLMPPAQGAALATWRPRAWAPPAPTSTFASGMRVAIDPVDGTLGMPSPEEMQQTRALRSESPVSTVTRADGSIRAALDSSFEEFAVVSLDATGKPVWTCVHGSQGAATFMKQVAVPLARPLPAPAPGTVWEAQ
jgi:hypothetical protein